MVEKKIDVRDQVTLSFEKSLRFCLKGISYRLFRSSLTLAVVVVAVAFFTVLLSESLMLRATSLGVREEVAEAREADTLMVHLFYRYSNGDLSVKLAGMKGDDARVDEFARVVGLSAAEAEGLVEQCYVEQLFLQFFRTLSPGRRVVLVRKYTDRDIFDFLAGQPAREAFETELSKMRSVRLPTSLEIFRSFLKNREAFLAALTAVREARESTIAAMETRLNSLTGGKDFAAWLGEASDDDVERWRMIVNESGFDLNREKMARVRDILQVQVVEDRVVRLLQTPEKREAWKVAMQSSHGLEDKLLMLKNRQVGELLGDAFSQRERAAVADRFIRMKRLSTLSGKLPAVRATVASTARFLDGRQVFLVAISFLVCMVGIANAMLMSITERFREIATMKCLGATDGFILKQFLIEAAIQGIVGGTAGMAIGLAISVMKSFLLFGTAVFVHFPAVQMVYCALLTVAIGIVLAMLASIYPSRAAARMAPMDAMRVE